MALFFQQVVKGYADKKVLCDIELAIEKNCFFALVGANGAGKTTLIKGMLDFINLDGGQIQIFGLSHLQSAARSRLVYLPEQFRPPWFLTGREFLQTMTSLHDLVYHESDALEMLADLELDKKVLDQSVGSCSKGMTQKLGLVACFLTGRELLVLDEPMSGLDPKARVLLKKRLMALKDAGRTLFFCTHLLADVEELCDQMAILHEGRICFIGSPAECRERYAKSTLETAFIQCINEKMGVVCGC